MGNLADLKKELRVPDISYWPEIRWWLAEGLHTDETIKKEIKMLYDNGFGAVEFLAMEEPGADSSRYGWGSEEWIHDSKLIFEEAARFGMGVSTTSGTNWSNANLTCITPDDRAAAKELDYVTERIPAGKSRGGILPKCSLRVENVREQELIAVVAVRIEEDGEIPYLSREDVFLLTNQVVEGELFWKAPGNGDYEMFFFWMHGTGQTAGPSVSTSYTVNYLDIYGAEALIDYWNKHVLTSEIKKVLPTDGRGMMYMDSLELTAFGKADQLWGYHFLEEFQRRRGYDLTPYLPFIVKGHGGGLYQYHYENRDLEWVRKLRNDCYQNMTELYMDNMLKPLQKWLHSMGMSLRAEISYGLPFEISLPGKYVDGIETESLEFCSQIESYRNLAGTAHIYNRIYSSETGASLLNYKMGLGFYTQIIYTQFAAGITKTVLHGFSSIAGAKKATYWPGHEGMWPIFGERFGPRQPSFVHYKQWTKMIARYQFLLRQGKPRMDIGILRLDYHFNNLLSMDAGNKEEYVYGHTLMRGNEGIYWKDMRLQNSGYTWDYFAPQILEEDFVDYQNGLLLPEGPAYKALILYQEELPVTSAKKIWQLAKKGMPILLIHGVNETIRPGNINVTHKTAASKTPYCDDRDKELQEILSRIKELPNVQEIFDQSKTVEALQKLGVYPYVGYDRENNYFLTHMREDAGKKYIFVYQMQYEREEDFCTRLKIEGTGRVYEIHCWDGSMEECGNYIAEDGYTYFDVTLKPGSATLFMLDTQAEVPLHVTNVSNPNTKVTLNNGKILIKARGTEGEFSVELSDRRNLTFAASKQEIITLQTLNLEVEDWNAGELKTITEDRGKGYVTEEIYYETEKKPILVGETRLIPWKDMEAVGPGVSGIGRYSGFFILPDDWNEKKGILLQLENVYMHTAAVFVNGKNVENFDMDALTADLSDLVIPGKNEILIEVSTSLHNRLQTRKYYENGEKLTSYYAKTAGNTGAGCSETEYDWEEVIMKEYPEEEIDWEKVGVKEYGLTGNVQLIPYEKIEVDIS